MVIWLLPAADISDTGNAGQNKLKKMGIIQLPPKSWIVLVCSWLFRLHSWWKMKVFQEAVENNEVIIAYVDYCIKD